MDFGDAFRELKRGARVRRASWPEDVTLFGRCATCGGELVELVRGRDWVPTKADLWADDWRVVEEDSHGHAE
jgi:hypothetical protein